MSSLSKKSKSSSTSKSTSKPSSSSKSTPTKRILTELAAYNSLPAPSPYTSSSPPTSTKLLIPHLSPSPSSILSLRAVLDGRGLLQDTPYKNGRWLLSISVPETYPQTPPLVAFLTPCCHANISFPGGKNGRGGEVCLDVLKENWTPVLGIVGVLECVGRLLGGEGDVDSPLNVDVANLGRSGDRIGERALVGFYCGEERWEGGLERWEAEGV